MLFPPACDLPRRALLKLCAGAGLVSLCGLPLLPAARETRDGQDAESRPRRVPDVPYEPTPQPVVDRMLEIAAVGQKDVLYDLGCGDGRIVITAAKRYGARGVGIDIDPQRIAEAQANAKAAEVGQQVRFINEDLFRSDFSDATVVSLFLWPHINRKLRPQLWQQLKPGTRVVSYIWDMGGEWPPEKTEMIGGKPIHYWIIP